MRKLRMRVLAGLLATLFICANANFMSSAEEVKVTKEKYDAYYGGAGDTFLCNQKSIGSKPGTEYYMTYTVEEYKNGGSQAGVIGTSDPTQRYPYDKGNGLMFYKQHAEGDKSNELLKEGYTYLIKFTALKSGFRYVASRAKGETSEYFVLDSKAGDTTKTVKCGYFGIWISGGFTNAKLTNIRFYDKDGNNLGVQSPLKHVPVVKSGVIPKTDNVEHWYTVKAKGTGALQNVALSNKLPLETNKMYIEYTVKYTNSKTNQTGVAFSNQPEKTYPHGNGFLRYEGDGKEYKGNLLLQEGAEYLIILERNEDNFTALVQITKDGKTTITALPSFYGTPDPASAFFSLWFGEGAASDLDFVLENVKMYDANYKDLGVQTNNTGVVIRHHGVLNDYSACQAVYYCKENNSMFALFADKSYVFTSSEGDVKGTYLIKDNKITFQEGKEKEVADYLFKRITTEDGKEYLRLYTYNVSFVADGDNDIETQVLSAKTGYYITEPKAPTYKDYEFDAWCTWDGEEYDLSQVVTESVTLYARWKDGKGATYLSQGNAGKWYTSPYMVIGASAVLLLLAIVGSICILKTGGKKHA